MHAFQSCVLGSIVVSIPACHAGDRGSIPRRGGFFFSKMYKMGPQLLVCYLETNCTVEKV